MLTARSFGFRPRQAMQEEFNKMQEEFKKNLIKSLL